MDPQQVAAALASLHQATYSRGPFSYAQFYLDSSLLPITEQPQAGSSQRKSSADDNKERKGSRSASVTAASRSPTGRRRFFQFSSKPKKSDTAALTPPTITVTAPTEAGSDVLSLTSSERPLDGNFLAPPTTNLPFCSKPKKQPRRRSTESGVRRASEIITEPNEQENIKNASTKSSWKSMFSLKPVKRNKSKIEEADSEDAKKSRKTIAKDLAAPGEQPRRKSVLEITGDEKAQKIVDKQLAQDKKAQQRIAKKEKKEQEKQEKLQKREEKRLAGKNKKGGKDSKLPPHSKQHNKKDKSSRKGSAASSVKSVTDDDPASWLYPLLTPHEISQLRERDAELFAFCLPEEQNREPSQELLDQLAAVQEERKQARLEEKRLEDEANGIFPPDAAEDVETGGAAAGDSAVSPAAAAAPAEGAAEGEEKPAEDAEENLLEQWREAQQLELQDNVAVQKELISASKHVPWSLYRKLKLLRLSKAYVERNEGQLSRGSATAENFSRRWKQFKRLVTNMVAFLVPWNSRIKEVESRFGSRVSGYFVFTRWLFWLNLFLLLAVLGCVVLPEYSITRIRGKINGTWETNSLKLRKEDDSELKLGDMLSLGGPILISPFYYGYYSEAEDWLKNYNIPIAYFTVYLLMLLFSLFLILQRMAQNTKQEQLSDSSEQYVFSWRLFVSWDYLIANGDSADNKIAAIQTSFKEAIAEVRANEREMNFWIKWIRRLLAHILWVGVLVLVVYSQQLAATINRNAIARERSGGKPVQIYEQYLNNILTMFWPAAGPIIFENIEKVDAYHPRTQAQVTFFRLVTLIGISMYGFISGGLVKIGIAVSTTGQ